MPENPRPADLAHRSPSSKHVFLPWEHCTHSPRAFIASAAARRDARPCGGMNMRNDQLRSPHTHAFSGTDVWALVLMRADRTGDRTAFVWHPYESSPRTWTYAQLARDAAAVASGLHRRGVGSADRALIHLENSPESVTPLSPAPPPSPPPPTPHTP